MKAMLAGVSRVFGDSTFKLEVSHLIIGHYSANRLVGEQGY